MPANTSRALPPRLVRPGERITAAVFNLLVRAVLQLMKTRIVAGPGLQVTQRGDSIVIGLIPGYERIAQEYRVSAVRENGTISTSTAGASVVARQDTISYDIVPYRAVQLPEMTDVTPDLGRVEDDTMDIRSAKVGDIVFVYRLVIGEADERTTQVHILNERLDAGTACPEPAP